MKPGEKAYVLFMVNVNLDNYDQVMQGVFCTKESARMKMAEYVSDDLKFTQYISVDYGKTIPPYFNLTNYLDGEGTFNTDTVKLKYPNNFEVHYQIKQVEIM